MTERINRLREYILDKRHFQFRQNPDDTGLKELNRQWSSDKLSPIGKSANGFVSVLKAEKPVILPGEKIVFTRMVTALPDIFTAEEWDSIKKTNYLPERGVVCNISPDYEYTLAKGFTFRLDEISERLKDPALTEDNITFLNAARDCIIALQDLIARYEELAISEGETDTAEVLNSIRTNGAGSYREALQLLRILHFAIWAAGNYHNTLGRFDRYMYPYYKQDVENGRITKEEALELTEEFFLACNRDTNLYPGMQQGDNGQSMVLGGRSVTGEYMFNELSEMCLQASYELRLIDPKINIRVDKGTPEYIYEMGSRLTKIGLGFPQYSNDDVIIPGLMKKGYTGEDAHDYVVAACWEFIIPKCAMDIPNIDAVSLIDCVSESIPYLNTCHRYDDFYKHVEETICGRIKEITLKHRNLYMVPSPMLSLLMDGTIAKAQDISLGAKYNNYGIPDSPNHPQFPSTILTPGETYKHVCVYKISVK